MWPSAGPPGTQVSMFGSATQTIMNDCAEETNYGETDCTGAALFGDYLCAGPLADGKLSWEVVREQRIASDRVYRVNCTLPLPDTTNSVMVGQQHINVFTYSPVCLGL